MKKLLIGTLVLSNLFIFSSCKKDSDDDDETGGGTKEFTINVPPTNSDYYIGNKSNSAYTKSYASWTTDFSTYTQFTDEFSNVASVYVDNDTVIIVGNQDAASAKYFIYFTSINDLKNFKKVESIYSPSLVSVINASVVTYNSTFNQTGYCRTKLGETAVTWNALPSGHTISSMKVVNNEILGKATVNGVDTYLRILDDGLSKNFNAFDVGNFNPSTLDYFDNKTWGLSPESWGSITTNDLANGTWTKGTFSSFIDGNTTDTVGTFRTTNSPIQMLATEWRIYGTIESTYDGTHYPCVNVSTDNGGTWATSFLVGMNKYSNNTSFPEIILSSTGITIIDTQTSSDNPPGIYSASDGINFSIMTASQLADYNLLGNKTYVR